MIYMFDVTDNLSSTNKCLIHTSFKSNGNWLYDDWEGSCFQPEDRDELKTAVDAWIDDSDAAKSTYGHINHWDVSSVTDMVDMFGSADSFNGDISDWDVSSVTDMRNMFEAAYSFNQDISGWDVSNVTNMRGMFDSAESFNQDISGWDVSSVEYMEGMFLYALAFNQDISGWNVSSVNYMYHMFDDTDDLSDDNKCAIHTSFSSNDNWEYDWEEYCSD